MGDNGRIHLPYLLVELARRRFQGRLTLMEGTVSRVVLLRGGKPVNVLSNQQDETLGRLLLEEGRLSQEQYRQVLDIMLKTGQRAGEVLVALNLLQAQEVYTALEFQCRRKLRNCFKMVEFGFTLEKAEIAAEEVVVSLEVPAVLLDGVPACYSVDRVLSEFPVDEETMFIRRQPPALQPLALGPREQRLLQAIGTGTSLMNLMKNLRGQAGLPELLPQLYVLHALQAIEASGVSWPDTSDLELEQPAPTPPTPQPQPGPRPEAPPEPSSADEEFEIEVVEMAEEELRPPTLKSLLDRQEIDAELARKMLRLDREDHFAVLEVGRGASSREIESAYRKLLDRYHLNDIERHYTRERERQLARQLLDRATLAWRLLLDDDERKRYLEQLQKRPEGAPQPAADPRLLADVEAQKAELAMAGKKYLDAIDFLNQAIAHYPNEPSYHVRLGQAAYFKALDETPEGQPLSGEVRKPFLKAIALDPSNCEARLYLAYISKRNGQLERALKEFQSVLQYNPHHRRAHTEIRHLRRRLQEGS